MKNLLFIPAYNCAKQIPRVLSQLTADVCAFFTEIIVINNRSTDNTEQVVLEYQKNHPYLPLRLLRNHENYGLGGSHKVAFQYAVDGGFDTVAVLHGDDQGNIKDLMPVVSSGEYEKYDCCLGARFLKQSKLIGYSRFRTFGNKVYDMLFSIVLGKRIYDLGSGLNLYQTKMLKSEFYKTFPDGLTFNYCMVLALGAYHQTHCFFPITWSEDDQVSNVKMFKQATTVLKMLFLYFLKRKRYLQTDLRAKKIESYEADEVVS